MTEEKQLEAIFETATANGFDSLNMNMLTTRSAEMLIGAGYTLMGLLFDHDFAKSLFGEVEMFTGGITVDEWRADWKANYLENKDRTPEQAKEVMQSDLDYFRKEGSILPAYLMQLKKLAVVEPKKRVEYIYKNMKKSNVNE